MANTMISPAPAEPEPQAKIGAMGRVIGVLTSPKATFEDIVRKPSWILPLIIAMLLTTGVGIFLSQKVDWRTYIRAQNEKSPAFDQLPEDQKAQRVEIGAKIAPIFSYLVGVFIPIGLLIFTLILWGAFNIIAGASLKFSTVWGIICHANVPAIFSSILAIVVLSMKPPGTADPQHFIATNLAAYLPSDAAHWLTVLGGLLDIFGIWVLVLTAIGFSVANPRKIKSGTAWGIVFGLWIAFVVIRVGIAAM